MSEPRTTDRTAANLHGRTVSRALALQVLCLYDALGDDFGMQVSTFLRDPENYADLQLDPPTDTQISLAARLANGAWQGRADYDRRLEEAVTDWSIKRMSPVDRNLLRLGLHEWLAVADTPFPVIVNELVELARRFGGADSPKFINGVLDGIRRKRDAAPAAAAEPETPPPA
jgi:transcription antitermination factor NusB